MPSDDLPNILLVICDDLALGDLSCYGNPWTRTPQLDALHESSRRLTGYRSGPVCTPARASLMTGRHHLRTGAIDTYLGRSIMHRDEVTLAECLRAAGYATGLFGKWHLGDSFPYRPQDRGFDEVLWHRGGGIGQPGDAAHSTYFDPILDHNGEPEHHHRYCTEVFTQAAADWIRHRRGQPWFAYVAPNCPHSPMEVPDHWAQPYRDRGLDERVARVYAMIENIDTHVGRLLATLDELHQADNTLVIFTSDHGQCRSGGAVDGPRFNAGLRGVKGTMYEGALRVPCLLRYPGRLAPGEDPRLASPMDWLPTLAALAEAPVPDDRVIDGHDLLAPPDPDRQLMLQWHRGDVPIRYQNYAVVEGRYKLTRPKADAPDELYLLPDESQDLAAQQPAVVERLRHAYDLFFNHLSDERGQETFAATPILLGADTQPTVELTRQDWRLYDPTREGWASDRPGWWPVDVVGARPCRIDIKLDPNTVPAELHLRCGAWQVVRPIHSTTTHHRFEDISLPTGTHRFEAYLQREGQRLGVERISIRYALTSGV